MSPTKIRKLPGQNKYRVYNGGKVTAKATTRRNARAQVRLLRMVEHRTRPV
jgi:hypothetical protein